MEKIDGLQAVLLLLKEFRTPGVASKAVDVLHQLLDQLWDGPSHGMAQACLTQLGMFWTFPLTQFRRF